MRPLVLLMLGLVLAAGCAPLQPWQRGRLVERGMNPAPAPLEAAYDNHVLQIREAALGTRNGSGPSCGCN